MEKKITSNQLDILIEPFFDSYFKNSEIGTYAMDSDRWFGIYNNDKLLIGHPMNDDRTWFFDGSIIGFGVNLFSLSYEEYSLSLKRYLNKKYPQLKIKIVK